MQLVNWKDRKYKPRTRAKYQHIFTYTLLVAGSIVFLIPLAWLLSTALGTAEDAVRVPHNFLPWPLHFENFVNAFAHTEYLTYLGNTLIVTILGIVGNLLSVSLVAYGFARMRFRGRDIIFLILLLTMMIPGQVLMVPTFILFKWFGWYDTLYPLFVPHWFAINAFGVFMLRQFFMAIPTDLDDAARIDGASSLRIFWSIILPLSKPALTTLAVLTFIGQWNDFIGPLIYIRTPSKQTFALALASLPSQYYTNYHEAMAAILTYALPCIIVFFFAQRNLLKGMALTGLGGK